MRYHITHRARSGWAATLLLVTAPIYAHDVTPFYTADQNPFIQIFGLPYLETDAPLAQGGQRVRVALDITNSIILGANHVESIEIDGETYRTTLVYRYGLGRGRELGFDLPYVSHEDGAFDHFIDDWHDTFGLSGRWREGRAYYLLNYSYQRDGVQHNYVTERRRGIGDMRLVGGLPLYRSEDDAARRGYLRAILKLPTGAAEDLLGSGAADAALSVSASDSGIFQAWHVTLFGAGGILWLGNGDVLPELQRSIVGFGSFGIGWRALSRLDLKLQVDMHSSFYRSELGALGASGIQLITGGSLSFANGLYFDLGVTENLTTDTTPDVVFNLALRKTF
ncbi:MAG: hypothetical protein A2V90_01120 [Gammaproteobacteria bacterium RBG_16_57_12]|nr:MAG: hypothetical protein A2V90_01120 [Gammaproteobacteria bacterium RBG_16_57_12]